MSRKTNPQLTRNWECFKKSSTFAYEKLPEISSKSLRIDSCRLCFRFISWIVYESLSHLVIRKARNTCSNVFSSEFRVISVSIIVWLTWIAVHWCCLVCDRFCNNQISKFQFSFSYFGLFWFKSRKYLFCDAIAA